MNVWKSVGKYDYECKYCKEMYECTMKLGLNESMNVCLFEMKVCLKVTMNVSINYCKKWKYVCMDECMYEIKG